LSVSLLLLLFISIQAAKGDHFKVAGGGRHDSEDDSSDEENENEDAKPEIAFSAVATFLATTLVEV
jgi:hypothetical protein